MKRTMKKSTWKITIFNTNTGKTSYRKVKKSYDDVTTLVKKIRNKNRHNSVCAEEMDKRGKDIMTNGRAVALDSRTDEKLFRESIRLDILADDDFDFDENELDFL